MGGKKEGDGQFRHELVTLGLWTQGGHSQEA